MLGICSVPYQWVMSLTLLAMLYILNIALFGILLLYLRLKRSDLPLHSRQFESVNATMCY